MTIFDLLRKGDTIGCCSEFQVSRDFGLKIDNFVLFLLESRYSIVGSQG